MIFTRRSVKDDQVKSKGWPLQNEDIWRPFCIGFKKEAGAFSGDKDQN